MKKPGSEARAACAGQREGGVLVLVMVVVVAVGVMGTALLAMGQFGGAGDARNEQSSKAYWIAEGGVYDAIAEVRAIRQGGWLISGRTFTNSLSPMAVKTYVHGDPVGNTYALISRAQVGSTYCTISQSIAISNDYVYPPNSAMISGGTINFLGTRAVITGDVAMAAGGRVSGSTTVDGDFFAEGNLTNFGVIKGDLIGDGRVINTNIIMGSLYATNGGVFNSGKVYGQLFAQGNVTNRGEVGIASNGNLWANGNVTNSGKVYGSIYAHGSITNSTNAYVGGTSAPYQPTLVFDAPPPPPELTDWSSTRAEYSALIAYAASNGVTSLSTPIVLSNRTVYYKGSLKGLYIVGPGTLVTSLDAEIKGISGTGTTVVIAGDELKFAPNNPTSMSNCVFYGQRRLYQDNQQLDLNSCTLMSPGVIDAKSFNMTDDNSVMLGGTINFYEDMTFRLSGHIEAMTNITLEAGSVFTLSTSTNLPPPPDPTKYIRDVTVVNMHGWTNNSDVW